MGKTKVFRMVNKVPQARVVSDTEAARLVSNGWQVEAEKQAEKPEKKKRGRKPKVEAVEVAEQPDAPQEPQDIVPSTEGGE